MNRDHSAPYLRLVDEADSARSTTRNLNSRSGDRNQQLALPYPDPFTAFFLDVNGIGVDRFVSLLRSMGPKWIIDARATPRLDMLGGSRSYAFRFFDNLGAEYVDLFGRLGLATYRSVDANPASWSDMVSRIVSSSARPFGPFLVLFDNADLLRASAEMLPQSLRRTLGRAVSCAVMT